MNIVKFICSAYRTLYIYIYIYIYIRWGSPGPPNRLGGPWGPNIDFFPKKKNRASARTFFFLNRGPGPPILFGGPGPPMYGGPGPRLKKIRAAAGDWTESLESGGPNFFPIAGAQGPPKNQGPRAPFSFGGSRGALPPRENIKLYKKPIKKCKTFSKKFENYETSPKNMF